MKVKVKRRMKSYDTLVFSLEYCALLKVAILEYCIDETCKKGHVSIGEIKKLISDILGVQIKTCYKDFKKGFNRNLPTLNCKLADGGVKIDFNDIFIETPDWEEA